MLCGCAWDCQTRRLWKGGEPPLHVWPLSRRLNLQVHVFSNNSLHLLQVEAAAAARAAITARLEALLGADGAILLPSTPTTAPRLGMTLAEIDPLWQRIICLVAPAAEAGLPQVRDCRGFPGTASVRCMRWCCGRARCWWSLACSTCTLAACCTARCALLSCRQALASWRPRPCVAGPCRTQTKACRG